MKFDIYECCSAICRGKYSIVESGKIVCCPYCNETLYYEKPVDVVDIDVEKYEKD